MDNKKLQEILNPILEFAEANEDILAVGLCGSYAKGTAKPYSDIDLSIITTDKHNFRDRAWIIGLKFEKIGDRIVRFEDKKYGRVWSRHVFLESGTEIEFSFADKSWVAINPVDEGTKRVVSDGYRILYDPNQILNRLLQHVNSNP